MSGLDNKVLYTIGNCSVKSLLYVIDLNAVTSLDVVDDDLSCECSSYGPVRICSLESLFYSADILGAAIIERSTEAYNEKLVLTDLVLVKGIVSGSVRIVLAWGRIASPTTPLPRVAACTSTP